MKTLVRWTAVSLFCLSVLALNGCMDGPTESAEETKSKYEQGQRDPAGDGR